MAKKKQRHQKRRSSQDSKKQSRSGGRFSERAPTGFRDRTGKIHAPRGSDKRRGESRPQHPSRGGEPRGGGVTGTVQKNRKGFAFLVLDRPSRDDIFIPRELANQFFHGDRVRATVGRNGEIRSWEILKHRFDSLVGQWEMGEVVYQRRSGFERIRVEKQPANIKDGDWVKVKLAFTDHGTEGVLVEHYGPNLPATADLPMVAGEFNLQEHHSEKAVQEAQAYGKEIPQKWEDDRKSLEHIPFITIDGETARDFDDAVFVEHKAGGFDLWVGIADVSYYVREGTALDKEAFDRGTSVYFPERAFHMLPRNLSENLCSLNPNVQRFAMVAKIHFDAEGRPQNTELMQAVIKSRRRATYEQIQDEYNRNQKNPKWEFRPHFELYRLLRKNRTERGSIDFDLPEAVIKLDEKCEPIEITTADRFDSHRLIEEFMIAANEAVTAWMTDQKLDFLFRVHEPPSPESYQKFKKTAASVGFRAPMIEGAITPEDLAKISQQIQKHPAKILLNTALLRSLRQAVYSAEHQMHFGLASLGYTHFTSPIRRYPDLVVHRLLKHSLSHEGRAAIRKHFPRDRIQTIAEHCSYRERLATEADREANRLKQIRYMKNHLGDTFTAMIVGMVERGLFCQIEDPYIEGFLPKDSLTDDNYLFNEGKMFYFGQRKRNTLRVGDKLEIQVVRASIETREIEFSTPKTSHR